MTSSGQRSLLDVLKPASKSDLSRIRRVKTYKKRRTSTANPTGPKSIGRTTTLGSSLPASCASHHPQLSKEFLVCLRVHLVMTRPHHSKIILRLQLNNR